MRRTTLERHDRASEIERGAEPDGLDDRPPAQLTTRDATREAQVVADHRAGASLPTERLGLDDQCRQAFGRRVDGRPEPCRASSNDCQVEDHVLHLGDRSERVGDLAVGGVRQDRLSHHLDDRVLDSRASRVGDRSPDLGVWTVDTRRNAEALQESADLTDTVALTVTHDLHGFHRRCGGPRPIAELLGDGAVELLVASAGRLGQERVGGAQRGGLQDRGRLIGSQAPFDQQDALGGGRHAANTRQHLSSTARTQVEGGEDHRDLSGRSAQLAKAGNRLIGRGGRLDPVVACIAAELLQHQPAGRAVLDHDHDHRLHQLQVLVHRQSGAMPVGKPLRAVSGSGERTLGCRRSAGRVHRGRTSGRRGRTRSSGRCCGGRARRSGAGA